MDAVNAAVAGGIATVVAAVCAWLSQKAAARASVINNDTTNRVLMEKEAYDRARRYDTDTIERQDTEIAELRTRNEKLEELIDTLRTNNARQQGEIARQQAEIESLNQRLARLEQSTTN